MVALDRCLKTHRKPSAYGEATLQQLLETSGGQTSIDIPEYGFCTLPTWSVHSAVGILLCRMPPESYECNIAWD
jgi:hypothetical protein